MSTRLILLGTGGGPTPKRHRAATAQAVTVADATYVVDCGNGVARQLVLAGVGLDTLRCVTITHHHSDHNADLGTLLHLAWCANLNDVVDVYGPPPLSRMMEDFFSYAREDIETRIRDEGRPPLRPMARDHEITGPGAVYEDDRVRITCAAVNHPPMRAYAYRIDSDDRSIVISGDTTPCPSLIDLARGADVLVHEVMDVPSLGIPLSRTNGSRLFEHLVGSHTSLTDVGRIAAAAQVATLVLSHLVPADADLTPEQWAKEAANGFDGTVVVGDDLMVL